MPWKNHRIGADICPPDAEYSRRLSRWLTLADLFLGRTEQEFKASLGAKTRKEHQRLKQDVSEALERAVSFRILKRAS
jgi:hypothetical protein